MSDLSRFFLFLSLSYHFSAALKAMTNKTKRLRKELIWDENVQESGPSLRTEDSHYIMRIQWPPTYWSNYLRWVQGGRGGRPATTISLPSRILLIFSSESPRILKFSKIIFFLNPGHVRAFNMDGLKYCNDYIMLESSKPMRMMSNFI